MPTWTLGRTGRCCVKAESSYGTAPAFTATDALRFLSINLPYNPKNRVWSPARFTDPSYRTRFTRRQSGSFDITSLLYPSGTLNTKPEADALLLNGLGAQANTTLATTLSGTPTTTTGTVASSTGLAVNQMVQITIGSGPNAGTYIRTLTGKATNDLTWAPALPSAPSAGDAVKGCLTYQPATALPSSLDIAHYADNHNREQLGCVADKVVLTFDAAQEPRLQVSGPAQGYAASAQAAPGTFTYVGAENAIPSGLLGSFMRAGVAYEILKATFEVQNAMELQNVAYGTSKPSAFYRKGRRVVNVTIDAMVSDSTALWDNALTVADQSIFIQCGVTAGQIWGVYVPVAEFELPDTPDGDETNQWSFKGVAKATNGNDEIFVGMA